jgi:hypothetical protein
VPSPHIKREYSEELPGGESPRYHEQSSLFVSQREALPGMDAYRRSTSPPELFIRLTQFLQYPKESPKDVFAQ